MWEISTPPHLAPPWIIHRLLFAENKWSRFSDFTSYSFSSLFRDESYDDGVSLPPRTCVPESKLIRLFATQAIGKVVCQEPIAASSPSRPKGNKASVGRPWQPGDSGRKCYYRTRRDKINHIDLTLWYTQQVCQLFSLLLAEWMLYWKQEPGLWLGFKQNPDCLGPDLCRKRQRVRIFTSWGCSVCRSGDTSSLCRDVWGAINNNNKQLLLNPVRWRGWK